LPLPLYGGATVDYKWVVDNVEKRENRCLRRLAPP
jgi:hypothetical protein